MEFTASIFEPARTGFHDLPGLQPLGSTFLRKLHNSTFPLARLALLTNNRQEHITYSFPWGLCLTLWLWFHVTYGYGREWTIALVTSPLCSAVPSCWEVRCSVKVGWDPDFRALCQKGWRVKKQIKLMYYLKMCKLCTPPISYSMKNDNVRSFSIKEYIICFKSMLFKQKKK